MDQFRAAGNSYLCSHIIPPYLQGTWVWTDGSTWDYPNWDTMDGEPDGGARQNCVAFNSNNNALDETLDQFYDLECLSELNYACKI